MVYVVGEALAAWLADCWETKSSAREGLYWGILRLFVWR